MGAKQVKIDRKTGLLLPPDSGERTYGEAELAREVGLRH
jgi:hypothetical protein